MNPRIKKLLEEAEQTLSGSPGPIKEEASIEIMARNLDSKIRESREVWDKLYHEGYKKVREAAKDLAVTINQKPKSSPRAQSVPIDQESTEELVQGVERIARSFMQRVKSGLLEPSSKIRRVAEEIIADIDAKKAAHAEVVAPSEGVIEPMYIEFFHTMEPVVSSFYATQNGMGRRIDEIMKRAGLTIERPKQGGGQRREGDVLMTTTEYKQRLSTMIEGLSKVLEHGEVFAEKFEDVMQLAVDLGKAVIKINPEQPKTDEPTAPVTEESITVASAVMPGLDDFEEEGPILSEEPNKDEASATKVAWMKVLGTIETARTAAAFGKGIDAEARLKAWDQVREFAEKQKAAAKE
jgi:hypothetical protein